MQAAREKVPKAERWKLTKNHSHIEMAHAALVAYEVMQGLLPKFGKHPKRDGKSNKELFGKISDKPVSAIVDSGANGVLITPATAKRKGLLDKIDTSHKVSINQANADQKFETFGTLKGGVPFQMKSVHGRTLTIKLPCHVAPVGSDLIGANEQGPLIKGIGGIAYFEVTRPDGQRATGMQMPDGEVVGLPANAQGMTVLPEIGQESEWAVQSNPMPIPELCEFLMSRERMRLKREAMPSLTAATSPAAALQAEQERLACQAQQLGLASTSPGGALDFGWSVQAPSQYGVQAGSTYSSLHMPQSMAQYNVQSAMIAPGAYPQMHSAGFKPSNGLPYFDGGWNSRREESVGVEDSEVPIRMLATHGANGGLPVERVHDILHRDAATNFRTFGPKSGGGATVMVDGKNVGSKLTKSDFVCRHDCAACRMTKMTAPWVRQKAAGLTADGSAAQILLERVSICEDCYACHAGALA